MACNLTFEPNGHIYRVDGVIVPSVTQVLEDVGIIDYSHIPYETRQAALDRGTEVHTLTQYDDENDLDESSVRPALLGYVDAWRRFRAWAGWTLKRIEYRDHHPYGYAGTLDREFNHEILVDIKTGEMPWWASVQLAAYAGILSKDASALIPYRRLGVQLNADGTFKPHEFPVRELRRDFDTFIAAHRVCVVKASNR